MTILVTRSMSEPTSDKHYRMLGLYVGKIWSSFNVHWTTAAGVEQALPGDTGWPGRLAMWKHLVDATFVRLGDGYSRSLHCEWTDPQTENGDLVLLLCDGKKGSTGNLGHEWNQPWKGVDSTTISNTIANMLSHPSQTSTSEVCSRCGMAALKAKMESWAVAAKGKTAPLPETP